MKTDINPKRALSHLFSSQRLFAISCDTQANQKTAKDEIKIITPLFSEFLCRRKCRKPCTHGVPNDMHRISDRRPSPELPISNLHVFCLFWPWKLFSSVLPW